MVVVKEMDLPSYLKPFVEFMNGLEPCKKNKFVYGCGANFLANLIFYEFRKSEALE